MRKEDASLALEVGVTTAIMSQGGRLEKLYHIIHEEIGCGGILDSAYTMSWIASEFLRIHEKTNWEELFFMNGPIHKKFLYRSEQFKKRGGYKEAPQYVTCWDDAAEDYAQWKIENFDYNEFERINLLNSKNPLL